MFSIHFDSYGDVEINDIIHQDLTVDDKQQIFAIIRILLQTFPRKFFIGPIKKGHSEILMIRQRQFNFIYKKKLATPLSKYNHIASNHA